MAYTIAATCGHGRTDAGEPVLTDEQRESIERLRTDLTELRAHVPATRFAQYDTMRRRAIGTYGAALRRRDDWGDFYAEIATLIETVVAQADRDDEFLRCGRCRDVVADLVRLLDDDYGRTAAAATVRAAREAIAATVRA